MTDDKQVQDDLSYVRSVLIRSEEAGNPATIYFLWGVISFFGFALIDTYPAATGFYWMIMGPLGGVLSAFLGWRAARAIGQNSPREGRMHAMHWSGLMGTILLVIPLAVTHGIAESEIPRLILLILAFSYWTAGVHLDRRLLWVSGAVAVCYLFTVFQRELPRLWTITGFALAASFVATGCVAAARKRFRRPA